MIQICVIVPILGEVIATWQRSWTVIARTLVDKIIAQGRLYSWALMWWLPKSTRFFFRARLNNDVIFIFLSIWQIASDPLALNWVYVL